MKLSFQETLFGPMIIFCAALGSFIGCGPRLEKMPVSYRGDISPNIKFFGKANAKSKSIHAMLLLAARSPQNQPRQLIEEIESADIDSLLLLLSNPPFAEANSYGSISFDRSMLPGAHHSVFLSLAERMMKLKFSDYWVFEILVHALLMPGASNNPGSYTTFLGATQANLSRDSLENVIANADPGALLEALNLLALRDNKGRYAIKKIRAYREYYLFPRIILLVMNKKRERYADEMVRLATDYTMLLLDESEKSAASWLVHLCILNEKIRFDELLRIPFESIDYDVADQFLWSWGYRNRTPNTVTKKSALDRLPLQIRRILSAKIKTALFNGPLDRTAIADLVEN